MSMRGVFKKAGQSMFDAFGDLIYTGTYTALGAWDPVTEATTGDVAQTVRFALPPPGKQAESDDVPLTGDAVATMLADEFTGTPKTDDKVLIDGIDYLVSGVDNLSGVAWRLQLSRL